MNPAGVPIDRIPELLDLARKIERGELTPQAAAQIFLRNGDPTRPESPP